MARAQKLKVYRTPAGFNDAYVAAPSQKAALEAWGSDRDLFARGIAERVTDPALTAEPLASPGVVIKHSRGTTAEQIRSMPDPAPRPVEEAGTDGTASTRTRKAKTETPAKPASKPKAASKPKPAPQPKPGSAQLEAAEDALAAVKLNYDRKMKALVDREAALALERRHLEKEQRDDIGAAEATVEDERTAYDDAMRQWRRSKGSR